MMTRKNNIAQFCSDPKNPFQVKAELRVRKMLEKHTDWRFEFSRNDFLYGVDIIAYKYILTGDEFERRFMGKIEVEASKQWRNGVYPEKWRTYSYLRRKVEQWNKRGNEGYNLNGSIWYGEPVENANKVVYVKCAIDMSDCHSALIADIWNLGKSYLIEDRREYLEESEKWYYRTSPRFDTITKRGWEETINFALKVFEA